MKRICIFLFLSFFTLTSAVAQESLKEEISKVKAPSSPAAMILGNQTNGISRPKSWEALETGIFANNFNDKGGFTIPKDLAIEFSPYWAQKDLALSIDKFLNPDVGLSLLQNFSFSVSTTQNFVIQENINTSAVGFGVRTMLWQGTRSEKDALTLGLMQLRNKIKFGPAVTMAARRHLSDLPNKVTDESTGILVAAINKYLVEQKSILFPEMTDASLDKFLSQLSKSILEKLPPKIDNSNDAARLATLALVESYVEAIVKLDEIVASLTKDRDDRKGFKLEVAGALALDFPTNETSFSVVPKTSFWMIPSFQPYKTDWLEILGLVKYSHYNLDFYEQYILEKNGKYYEHNFDYGLRVVFKRPRFSIEFEALGRDSRTIMSLVKDGDGIVHTDSKQDHDGQFLFNFNYQINNNITLSYNFGKQFSPVLAYKGNLVSLATLNLGIGSPKIADVKK